MALIGAVVLLVAGPVFLLWGGFIPPHSASNGAGVSLSNGIRSTGYAGAIIALFAPEIYAVLVKWKWLAFAIAIVNIALSFAIDRPIVPLASLLGPLLSEPMIPIAGIAFNVLLSLMAVAFLSWTLVKSPKLIYLSLEPPSSAVWCRSASQRRRTPSGRAAP